MSRQINFKPIGNGDLFLELADFSAYLDVSIVSYYELETVGDKLLLRFYDKDMNLIHPFTVYSNGSNRIIL